MLKARSYVCHGQGEEESHNSQDQEKGSLLGLRLCHVTRKKPGVFLPDLNNPKGADSSHPLSPPPPPPPPATTLWEGQAGEEHVGLSLNLACTFPWVLVPALSTLAV